METYKVKIELTKHDALEIASALYTLAENYKEDANDIASYVLQNKMLEQADYAEILAKKFAKIYSEIKDSPF